MDDMIVIFFSCCKDYTDFYIEIISFYQVLSIVMLVSPLISRMFQSIRILMAYMLITTQFAGLIVTNARADSGDVDT